ncbi:MAG: internalization-related competence protein ComEC/Rec2 [Polaromonas sp.]|nr:internalization-related competence protein ComEC/Rec2 [Polaromonas sp.]
MAFFLVSRPLVGLSSPGPGLAGFIAGVALQLQQPDLWLVSWYAALAALALAGVLAHLWTVRRSPRLAPASVRYLLAFMLAAALGFGLTGWRAGVFQAGALNPALEGRDIAVTGQVLAMPQPAEDGLRFRLRLESAQLDGQPALLPPQLMLGWYAGFGAREAKSAAADSSDEAEQALALELQRQPQPMRAGERWQMTVRLKAPNGNSNPHGFDHELWLWEQGIQATGYVRAGPHDAPPRKLSDHWRYPVERARQSVREAIYAQVADRQLAGVLAALVMGDQGAIELDTDIKVVKRTSL